MLYRNRVKFSIFEISKFGLTIQTSSVLFRLSLRPVTGAVNGTQNQPVTGTGNGTQTRAESEEAGSNHEGLDVC